MPALPGTPSSLETAQGIFASGLLLAVSLLAPVTLRAQINNLQTSQVAQASTFTDSENAASLPEAPHPASNTSETKVVIQAASAFPAAASAGGVSAFPNFRQRERHFLMDLVGPTAFIAPAFESGIDLARPLKVGPPFEGVIAPGNHTAHGDVPEWGEGAQGYAKRYADRLGQGLVGTTSRYALGEIMREDVSYHRCQCTGLLPRTAHAFVGAWTAHTQSGRAVPSLPAVASPFIASEVAVAGWYPARYDASDALRISVLNYVAAPFKNLFAEFIAK